MSESHSITQARVHELFDYREDGVLLWKQTRGCSLKGNVAGWKMPNGYFNAQVDKKNYGIHRLIFMWHYGYFPKEVDHVDNNPSNNKIENLREANRTNNCQNTRIRKTNKSGCKGVSWFKKYSKWIAQIQVNKKKMNLGYFDDPKEAAEAYKEAAIKNFGKFANY